MTHETTPPAAAAAPSPPAAAADPSSPSSRGPAIIVGLTLAILATLATALLVVGFTMPEWQGPQAVPGDRTAPRALGEPGEDPFLPSTEWPLRVTLSRLPESQVPEAPARWGEGAADAESEWLQVVLSHPRALAVKAFRMEVRVEVQQQHAGADEAPLLEVIETMPGIQTTSLLEKEGIALELTTLRMPIHALPEGQRIAVLHARLPLARRDAAFGSLLVSDILVAEIVDVDPPVRTQPGQYARTELVAE